ncbi:bifunctional UDP-sugar hydrolase/5'-nucleotidase [Arcanobacterium hippocoleae]
MKNKFMRPLAGGIFALSLVLVPAVSQAAPETPDSPPQPGVVKIDLYKLTDIHGHIELVENKGAVKEAGIPAVGCYLADARADNPNATFTLLGDNIGASPFTSGAQKDNPTIAALNYLPVDASTIGNHELDLGQEVFKARIDGSQPADFVKVKFPYLGANVKGMGNYQENGKDTPYLKDMIIEDLNGVKVAFIGAIAQDVPYKLSPEATKGLKFTDPIAEITKQAKALKAEKKADIVVAMLDDDVKNNFAKMPAEVDVLMGGDTHVPYEFDAVNSKVKLNNQNNPLLAGIASGSYTDNLGLVQISYDTKQKKILSADSILIPAKDVVAKVKQDRPDCLTKSDAAVSVQQAAEKSKEAGKKPIVTNVKAEWRRGVYLAPENKDPKAGSNRGIESTLGNLVADSILDQVKIDGTNPVDIGVINAGGLRTDLIPENGTITYAQTFQALPFSNEMGYAPVTGAQFKQALENQWKTGLNSQNSRPMLRMGTSSNLTYTYDAAQPAGKRITSIMLNGKPMDMNKTYNVGSMTFVLQGGDGYFDPGLKVTTFGVLDRDAFNAYLQKVTGPKLAAANLKRGVGLSLPENPLHAGDTLSIPMRGLSFSEGPGITKNVHVTVGDVKRSFPVQNSLLEPDASAEKSIITTDGAGQAVADFKLDGVCTGQTGVVNLPVTVATDFGTVVSAANGLTVKVDCTAAGAAAKPNTGNSGAMPKPDSNKSGAASKSGSKQLAKTGSSDVLGLGFLAFGAVAAGTVFSAATRKKLRK